MSRKAGSKAERDTNQPPSTSGNLKALSWILRAAILLLLGIALFRYTSIATNNAPPPTADLPTQSSQESNKQDAIADASDNLQQTEPPNSEPSPESPEASPKSKSATGSKPEQKIYRLCDDLPELKELFDLIADKSLELKPREMDLYWRLVKHVREESIDGLFSKATTLSDRPTTNPKAADRSTLYIHSAKHRSELYRQTVNVRRVTPDAEGRVFEIWCSQPTSPLWLQVLITPELPEGYTAETLVGKQVDMAGYYFKLQGFLPGRNSANGKLNLAPVFVGKCLATSPISATSAAPSAGKPSMAWLKTFAMIGILLTTLLFVIRWLESRTRKPVSREDRPVDLSWLDEHHANDEPEKK